MIVHGIAQDQNPWWALPQVRPVRHLSERRDLFQTLRTAVLSPGQNRAQVLLGARQVGKSTLMLQLVESLLDDGVPAANVTFFDFSDDRLSPRSISPREVVDLVMPGVVPNAPRYFFFDEITWALSGWDRWLKQAVDASRRAGPQAGFRYIVTSSAASLLADASLESGQGRWDDHFLEGMTFLEYQRLSTDRRPELVLRYLRTGGYPGQLWEDNPGLGRKRLREDIIDRAILHDLLIHGVDVARVKALFTYLIQASGSQWEAGNRARDLDADPRTASQWLRLLEQTGLVAVLPRWTPGKSGKVGKASSELRQHPKVFAADHGLVLAFAAQAADDAQVQGRVFETVVYRHLRSLADDGVKVAYFRADDRYEIDFVVSLNGAWIGVEVTSAKAIDDRKIAKLIAAGARMRAKRLVLIYGGLVDEERQGIKIVPLHRFLTNPGRALEGVEA
jgi:predicted AAA+ superfamily ATPase